MTSPFVRWAIKWPPAVGHSDFNRVCSNEGTLKMHDLSEQKRVRSLYCLVHSLQSDWLRWAGEAAQIFVSLLSLFPSFSVNKVVFLPLYWHIFHFLFSVCFFCFGCEFFVCLFVFCVGRGGGGGWFCLLLVCGVFFNYWILFPLPNCLQLLFCLLYWTQKGMKTNKSWKRNKILQ